MSSKPNIVFIYVDDQAAWTIGAYGNAEAHTPNLDRLAREGVLLENCFCSTPVCSPARAAMMTGRTSCETRVPDFIPNPKHPAYTHEWADIGLDGSIPTWPAVLAQHGYTNALVGKWHIGDWTQDPQRRFHPCRNGYESFFGLTGGGVNPLDPEFEEDGELRTFSGYCDDILTDRAVAFLDAHGRESNSSGQGGDSDQQKPFLLSLHLRQPHSPWEPIPASEKELFADTTLKLPETDVPDVDTEALHERMRLYMSAVAGVDRMVGRVFEALDRNGLDGDTLFIFSADHGYMMGHNGLWHKGNGIWATRARDGETGNRWQPNLSEPSLRVPALVRWPGHIAPGLRLPQLVSDVDWFPTLLELTGCPTPASGTRWGRSFAPLLFGKSTPWRDAVYSEYDMCIYARARLRALRGERWKLIADFRSPWCSAFYDLEKDPGETANLLGAGTLSPPYREEVKQALSEMADRLLAVMRGHDDPLLKQADALPF
jgi:uncharacterized sulfatase